MGTDKKYYVLDFARVFPPEHPKLSKKNGKSVFYHPWLGVCLHNCLYLELSETQFAWPK